MWNRILNNRSQDFLLTDTLSSVSRGEIRGVMSIYMLWFFIQFTLGTQEENLRILPISAVFLSISFVALRWISKNYFFANIVWLLGLAGVISAFLALYQFPEIGLFFIFLPLLAAIVLGWPFAALIFALDTGLILWFHSVSGAISFSPNFLWIVILGGMINLVIGSIASYSFLNLIYWSMINYQKARDDLEVAREERLEYRQMQEDLLHANKELARLSQRLKGANQAVEEAIRVKEEFVANVSHELRTPLNMIIGFCETITQSPHVYGKKLPDRLLADIFVIQRNSEHLSQLVNDVLDLSQIEAGRMALSKQWVVLQDIIKEAIDTIKDFFESKQLYLRIELPEEPILVFCDRTRIREVILNIVSNAGRFTESGGVEIRARTEGDLALVSLSDTGPGIAEVDQKRLFEPFQQLDGSIRRKYGGSGLGLHISKQFVDLHHGKMWLESVIGQGTTFYFSLPLLTPVDSSTTGAQHFGRWVNPYLSYEGRTRKFQAPAPKLTPRYLLLESDDTLERIFKRYTEDIEIEPARTIEKVIEISKEHPVNAVIINVPPNTHNDSELSSLKVNLPYGTPVISCWIQGNDPAAHSLGVVEHLVKPINREAFLATMENLPGNVRKVLLVDHNPEALQLFSRILSSSRKKYQIMRAQNGSQALEMLRKRKPDLMLMELVLDEIDGFEVLRRKNLDPTIHDIPVIITSSLDPTGTPIVSDALSITHKGGLSVRELLDCIQATSFILMPHSQSNDQAYQAAFHG
jgi:signal transduction histidine kinase/CheY-like chemotaxis protein